MRSMMLRAARTAASLALLAAVTVSEAGAQGYTYQLQARTAVTGGAPAFNLPGTATSGLSGSARP
jgi:hypothetical protein